MVDIGNIIKTHLRQTGSSVNQLAKQIKISDTVLYHNFKTNHLTLARLELISRVLNHNFFIYFVQQSGSSEEQLLKLSSENKELTSKLASLQKEVTYLQEINALLKARQ
jgi:ribosome-binding protein aMBF1 (putative translation factor)